MQDPLGLLRYTSSCRHTVLVLSAASVIPKQVQIFIYGTGQNIHFTDFGRTGAAGHDDGVTDAGTIVIWVIKPRRAPGCIQRTPAHAQLQEKPFHIHPVSVRGPRT